MLAPILATKLYIPPARPQLISRPRLTDRLNQGLQAGHKLSLISAPPGFGKTTLLSDWLNERVKEEGERIKAERVAWVSLDEYDNDPVRFWSYVITALDRVQSGLGEEAMTLLHSPQPPPLETILITLLNTVVTLPHQMGLILDDYHLIDSEIIHHTLTFLLDHLPPQLHLVITSRADPPLPLTRLRVRGQLTELREGDLRFTLPEAVAFLNQVMRLDLSPEDIIALEGRTEGWIAGLQLAALSMQGCTDTAGFVQAFTGSHRYVLDYLAEEVLARQPETIQTFLLRTAILERLCGPLGDALAGDGGWEAGGRGPVTRPLVPDPWPPAAGLAPGSRSQQILEYLEQANLFLIPLDNQRRWYRYHHLFADFLRARLRATVTQAELAALYLQAGRWCAASGFTTEAINYILAAGEMEQAAQLIEEVIIARLTEGEATTVIDWLALLPDTLVRSRPRLSLGLAWARVITGQWDKIEGLVQDAEKVLSAREATAWNGHDPAARSMWGEIAAIRALMMSNEGQALQAIELCHQALERLPQDNLIVRSIITRNLGIAYEMAGELEQASRTLSDARALAQASDNLIITLSATGELAQIEQERGRLGEAIGLYQQELQWIKAKLGTERPAPIATWAYLALAEVLREQNKLEMAKHYLTIGLELERQAVFGVTGAIAHLILARILQAEGDSTGASEAIQQAIVAMPGSVQPLSWIKAVQAALWLAQGNLTDAANWAENCSLPLDEGFDFARYPGEYAILARVYIAQHRFDEACRLLERMQAAAAATGRRGRLVEIFLLQALARYSQGNTEQAMPLLVQALVLGQPGGYVRMFADEGAPLAALLHLLKTRGMAPDAAYVDQLLAALPEVQGAEPGHDPPINHDKLKLPAGPTGLDLIEPLSERELEILRLLVAGLSNQEIAGRLIIAEGTVKKHLHNIFGKLNARSRTQAILRAADLNLL